jgi:hypothetical protein
MLTIVGSRNNILAFRKKGHAPNHVFRLGQKIMYEGEEARIIRLSPFPVVKTGSRVICGALLTKIEQIKNGKNRTL